MPVPLAHPAAVLPLRRYCPKYLSFSALIIGSVAPDFAYGINFRGSFQRLTSGLLGPAAYNWLSTHGIHSWDSLSHSVLGSVFFCLPVGLLVSLAFRATRTALVATLPNPHRDLLLPLCLRKRHSVLAWTVSLLIGTFTHLAWDSLAKDDWWFARLMPVMREDVLDVGSAHLQVFRAVWIISSIGGTLVLIFAYLAYLRRHGHRFWELGPGESPYYYLWSSVAAFSALIPLAFIARHGRFHLSANGIYYAFHGFYAVYVTIFGICVAVIALISMARGHGSGTQKQ